jgi:methionine aminopeptidase
MESLHPIGVSEEFRGKIEGVHPDFLQSGILWARDRSWEAFHQIKDEIREGLTELEARRLAVEIFTRHGVTKHWHQPSIRFGSGTTLTFNQPLRDDYRLKSGDPVFMDLGPVWTQAESLISYEGDVGDSFVFGENPAAEKCITTVRALFDEGKALWEKNHDISGKEIYRRLTERANQQGYELIDDVVGHRIGDFPHQKFSKEKFPKIEFRPSAHLWILELQIVDRAASLGAFYEDVLF